MRRFPHQKTKVLLVLETVDQEVPHWDCKKPHALVVDRDEVFGANVVNAMRARGICAKHSRTVDDFLDLNCRARVDLVGLEVDAMDPQTLDNLLLLRTHFGEGPVTRIVAAASFAPGSFPHLVEQRGADACISRRQSPQAMAEALETQLRKHRK